VQGFDVGGLFRMAAGLQRKRHEQSRPKNTTRAYTGPQKEFRSWCAADFRSAITIVRGFDICAHFRNKLGEEKKQLPAEVTPESVFLYAQTYLTLRRVSAKNKKLLEMSTIRTHISGLSDLYAKQRSESSLEVIESAIWTGVLKTLLGDEEQRRLYIRDAGSHDYVAQ
jgi:hypothetical protein